MKVVKTIINKIDLLFPDPFIGHQISSWKESKQESFLKTLNVYLKRELAFANVRNLYQDSIRNIGVHSQGKKGWERIKAELLP